MVAVSGKYEEYRESRVIVFDRDQQLQMEMAKHKQQFVGGQYGYADPTWDCAAAAHSLGLFVCRGVDDSESHEYHTAGPLPITINGNVPQFHVRFGKHTEHCCSQVAATSMAVMGSLKTLQSRRRVLTRTPQNASNSRPN